MVEPDFVSKSVEAIEKTVKRAWLFDVDGVLTNIVEKRLTEERLLDLLVGMLERWEPLALNTGRSIDFIIEQILNKLEEKVVDKSLLKNMLAVGEKGSVWISYDKVGKRLETIDQSVAVPVIIQAEVRSLVNNKFSEAMFYDETKKTMISVEMHNGYNWYDFKNNQIELDKELIKILEKHDLVGNFKMDPVRISTDIEHKHVGKDLGARRFIDWLKDRKIKPEKFVGFGDSRSDVSMAEEIYKQGLPMEFVFVGEKNLLAEEKFSFPITYTEKKFEAGTLEYLTKII